MSDTTQILAAEAQIASSLADLVSHTQHPAAAPVAEEVAPAPISAVTTITATTPAQALDEWLAAKIHNTILSQDTPRYNRVYAAYRTLRDMVE